jgi:hypothetical protein
LPVRIQKALAVVDYLRNEVRMLGAVSVGPIDMGTQVMSVARVGPPQFGTNRHSAKLRRPHRRHIDRRIQGAVSLRRFAGTELKMQGGSSTDSGGLFKGRVGQRKA